MRTLNVEAIFYHNFTHVLLFFDFCYDTALAAVAEQITAQLAAAAAAAAEAAAAQAGEDGEGGGEAPAGVSELLKPYKEAEAVLETVWNLAVSASGVAAGRVLSLLICWLFSVQS